VRRAFEEYATGRFTKQQLLKQSRAWGLTNRRARPLTSQAIGMLLRNQLYAGIVDVPEYRVRGKRGDFEPLISEDLFYRVQAVLSGRVPSTTPQQRAHPDFPLRAFVRCESCGRGLTGSWSKGRSEYYAYYHCRPGCRAVNVTKAKLEGLSADELALLQPSPGYMRLLKESVLQIWKERKAAVSEEIASAERTAKAIQDKLNRLDEAFLFDRSIDIETYDRHAEKLREELTLARIDRQALRPGRRTRRRRHPGVRRTDSAARVRSVGAGVAQPASAVPTTVLSGWNRVRRKSLYWNRRNRTGLQLLAGNQNRK